MKNLLVHKMIHINFVDVKVIINRNRKLSDFLYTFIFYYVFEK